MDFVNKEGYTNYTMNDIENLTNLYNTTGGGRKSRKSRKSRKINQRAGGSDWGHTLYSRGPVNAPSNPDTFQMFAPMSDYISNAELLKDGPK